MTDNYGLGSDGYIAIQKETSPRTALTDYSNIKTLPVNFESFIKYYRENIEKKNLLGKRHKRKNDLGFEIVEGQIILDVYPTLFGYLLHLFLGNPSTNTAIAITDSNGDSQNIGTSHVWKQNLTNTEALNTFMIHQAFGSKIPEQFNFCIFNSMTLECEKGSNLKITLPVSHGHLDSKVLTRRTTFTYPAESPINSSNIVISEGTLNNINVHSFSLGIDLNYRKNEFFLGSSKESKAFFNGIPSINLSLNVDADKRFIDLARNNTYNNFTITMDSNLKLDATQSNSRNYKIIINLPSCQLNPQTALEHSEERLTMDLEFDCGFANDTNDESLFTFTVDDTIQTYT